MPFKTSGWITQGPRATTYEYVENTDQAAECLASAQLCVAVVAPLICIQN